MIQLWQTQLINVSLYVLQDELKTILHTHTQFCLVFRGRKYCHEICLRTWRHSHSKIRPLKKSMKTRLTSIELASCLWGRSKTSTAVRAHGLKLRTAVCHKHRKNFTQTVWQCLLQTLSQKICWTPFWAWSCRFFSTVRALSLVQYVSACF